MANLDAPFGFRVARHVAGGTPNRLSEYPIASAYNTAIFTGDMVKTSTDGFIERAAAGDAVALLGVFAGVHWINSEGEVRFAKMWTAGTVIPAGSQALALVYDDPTMTFMAQVSTGITVAQTHIGQFFNILATAGDAASGDSREEVGATGGSEAQLRLMRVLELPQRTPKGGYQMSGFGEHAIAEVKIALHEYAGTAAVEV